MPALSQHRRRSLRWGAAAIIGLCSLTLFAPPIRAAVFQDAASARVQRTDAATLFRDEVIDATARLRWKGPALTDEARFAAASSGLSWQPQVGGQPLFVTGTDGLAYAPAAARYAGFNRARSSGALKEAFAFGLSIVLEPPAEDLTAWRTAFEYLREYGVDFDRALMGVLHAPEKLPVLPTYQYSAMDALVHRATPRLTPLFLAASRSSDRYLRSRAVTALGVIGYQERKSEPVRLAASGTLLQELGVSAVQRSMMLEAIREAAKDKSYRVRAAAAMALGLAGEEEDVSILERLLKDRAYVEVSIADRQRKGVVYPVRFEAATALRRFEQTAIGAAGKGADRGGQNVTQDRADMRRDQVYHLRFGSGYW